MNNKLICNICIEPIEENSIDTSLVRLRCVPDKHYFCRKCIIDWYKELIENQKKGIYADYKYRMCPLCRGDGGYIHHVKPELFIKGIHKKEEKKKKEVKNKNNNQDNLCIFMINENKRCSRNKNKSNNHNYCTQHFNIINKKNNNQNNNENNNENNNLINNQNNNLGLENKKEEYSELEQFELGYNEVKGIYDDYENLWKKMNDDDKKNERCKMFEMFQMLKDQILTLLNIISNMMDENKDENNIIKLMDNQFKTLQLEESINVMEMEMITFDDHNVKNNNLNENNYNNFFNDENIISSEEIDLNEIMKDLNLNENNFENLEITFVNDNVKNKKNKN